MNSKLGRDEFSESLDRRLSGLQGDPWLRAKVLAKAEGEKPMKKTATVPVVIAVLLVITIAGALALSGWNIIARVLGGERVNEESVTSPLKLETDIQSLRFTATEAYWAKDGLSVALRMEPTRPGFLPYYEEGEHPERIDYNGETISADEFRGENELIACEIFAGGDCWTWYNFSDEGYFIMVTVMDPDAEALEKGTTVSFSCCCTNLQSGETEEGTISVDLPPLEMQRGYTDDE